MATHPQAAQPRKQHALPLAEAVEAELPHATERERSELVPYICVEWHRTCVHIEERLEFLARHAGKRCPV